MPYAAGNEPVLVLVGKLLGIGTGVGMRRAVGVSFKCDRRHADHRRLCKPSLQLVILWLAFREAEPLAVIVDNDRHMMRIVEGPSAALEGGIVEIPLRRSKLPDEPGEIPCVFLVASTAAKATQSHNAFGSCRD